MFRDMKEVKRSEEFRYCKELGYTDSQAITFTLLRYDRSRKMMKLGQVYSKQSELSFSEVVEKYYFDDDYLSQITQKKKPFPYFTSPCTYACVVIPDSEMDITEDYESYDTVQYKDTDDGAVCAKRLESYLDTTPSFSDSDMYPEPDISVWQFDSSRGYPSSSSGEPSNHHGKIARTDSYTSIRKRGWRNTVTSPAAVFKPTHNSAAAGIIAANIRAGEKTTPSMMRMEELLNYISYDLKQPEGAKFELTSEILHEKDETWLFLGVQGEHVCTGRKNICLLLDVSGSMRGREECITGVTAAVLAGMNPGDVLSLVTYSDEDHVVINNLVLDETKNIDQILEVLSQIEIYGCTNGSAGLHRAYELIERNHISDGVNRVIIVTDGDFNFGTFDNDSLSDFIRKKRETDTYFSVIGTGIRNLKDDRLEMLAENGNGNYFAVNSLKDVERSVRSNYEALMYPIAKNVKAMVEFNPNRISAWKLVGYENRMLEIEEFRDDSVKADPFGSGAYFIGLFRIKTNVSGMPDPILKYRNYIPVNSSELGTLTLRYEDIGDNTVKEMSFIITDEETSVKNAEKAVRCAKHAEKFSEKDYEDEIARREIMRLIKARW